MFLHHAALRATLFTLALFSFALFAGVGALAQGTVKGMDCEGELKVTSHTHDGQVTVDVVLTSMAPPQVVWAVMTDYEHATRFIRNLKRSNAVIHANQTMRVTQVGRAEWGPFGADVLTEYDVSLHPDKHTLQGKLVRGDVTDMWLSARLTAAGSRTELTYQNTVKPAFWMPLSVAKPMLTQRATESFGDLQAEISRRAGQHCNPASAGNPP